MRERDDVQEGEASLLRPVERKRNVDGGRKDVIEERLWRWKEDAPIVKRAAPTIDIAYRHAAQVPYALTRTRSRWAGRSTRSPTDAPTKGGDVT